jgi:hypothetical protein
VGSELLAASQNTEWQPSPSRRATGLGSQGSRQSTRGTRTRESQRRAEQVGGEYKRRKKLRIVTLIRVWHGRAWTMDESQTFAAYGLPSWRGGSAGVAKRPRERSPTRNRYRCDSQLLHLRRAHRSCSGKSISKANSGDLSPTPDGVTWKYLKYSQPANVPASTNRYSPMWWCCPPLRMHHTSVLTT